MPDAAPDPLAQSSASRRLETLAEGQRRVVGLIAKSAPLPEILDVLCRLVESQLPSALCSVILLDADGTRVKDGAGPSLPSGFRRSIDNLAIGPKAGSCGTAIHHGRTVIVEDIASDPLWDEYRALALPHGLAAAASTPIFDGDENVLGSFAIYHHEAGPFGRDEMELLGHINSLASLAITHQRQMERLHEQMEHLTAAQHLASLGFWTWQIQDNRVEWSDGLYAIYGLDQTTFGASFEGYLERVHPEDRTRVQAIIAKALEARGPFAFEERIIRPDGGLRWLRSWGTVIVNGERAPERMMGTCHDITELKTRELELLQFRALIENSPDFIAMASMDAQVLYVNPAGLRMTGFHSLEAARASTIRDFLTDEGYQRSREIEVPAILEKGHWEGESTLRNLDGEEPIPVQVSSFLVKDPLTGEPLCLATSQHDIRVQKQTEEALRQAQKMESLAVLAGGIAHDFNNLLTAILSNLELAKVAVKKESNPTDYLERMGLAVNRASDLAKQMLAYSGKGRVVVRAVDINALLREMVQLISASLPKKVRFSLILAPNLPSMEADVSQLQQIVMNLAINAAESLTEAGGNITLTTRLEHAPLEPKLIFPGGAGRAERFVRLEVADTGVGMAPDVKARIFDPFFSTKTSGRGLGLSAILSILRGHHAGIAVESEVGKGTRFSLVFPTSEKASTASQPIACVEYQSGGLVLVVDDEDDIREAATAMLEHLGFECLNASDGEEAIALVRSRGDELRLVLLDLSMPKKDGREAFQAILILRPDLKVILTSGFDMKEAARGIVGQGLAGFLQKPYRLDDLRRAVQAALTG